jgi:hypothetical protein
MAAGITSQPIDFRTIFSLLGANLWTMTAGLGSTIRESAIFKNARAEPLGKQGISFGIILDLEGLLSCRNTS